MTFLAFFQAGGIIGYIITALSVAAVALMIEYVLAFRRQNICPQELVGEVLQQLAQGQLTGAVNVCKADNSVLSKILLTGLTQCEFGWEAVDKSGEEEAEKQAAALYQKIEYLNVIANIAPMLGLLGTVVGMVFAFQQLAQTEGYARAADLAEGIYLALITTVQGLVVAIPCLAAHSFFQSRITTQLTETVKMANKVFTAVRRGLRKKDKQ